MVEREYSESSQPERLIRVSTDDIRRRKRTEEEELALERIAARQAAGDNSGIDYDDIPPSTEEQLASAMRYSEFRRLVPVNVRLDPKVVEWLKSKSEAYSLRINDILMNVMEAELAAGSRW